MRIDKDHMYHGAALIQVAEHRKFTAINSLKTKHVTYRNAYMINNDVGLYLKYASRPTEPHEEYIFTFNEEHLDELSKINKSVPKLYLGLVLVGDRQVCCLNYKDLIKLIKRRKRAFNSDEAQYTILVTAPARKNLRVYINKPGVKNLILGKSILVKRNAFPDIIFG